MKNCIKFIAVIFVVIIISMLSLTAFGVSSVEDNPITIVVKTDKNSYSYTKIAVFDVTVTNSSQNIIENVTAQVVFDELSPVAKGNNTHKKEVKELKPGESFSFAYKATLNPNKNKLNFFQKIIFWFVQLFNNGYDVSTERINDGRNIAELVMEIDFGKFKPTNIVEVAYNLDELPEQPSDPNNNIPEKVTGITVTKIGSDYISLMWDPSVNADSYLMLISPKGASKWSSEVINHTAFTFDGLMPETAYEIVVYASKDGTLSEKSNTVMVVTNVDYEEPTTSPTEPTTNPTKPTDPSIKPTTIPSTNVSVQGVKFTKRTTSMTIGETFSTEIKIEPADANNAAVTYMSSDPSVAQIDKTGKITAIGLGVTKITVKTDDGDVYDSFTLKVVEVNLQSVSVESSYLVYVREPIIIKPTFFPENASDKSFILTASDYTYTYKGGLFGTTNKTDVCIFSDYFQIDNDAGIVLAKKATIEPETGDAFSFTVTLSAANGKTASFKLSAVKRLISVYYEGEDNPWCYGSTVKLSAEIDSSAGFGADSLIWTTSDRNIATVSENGTVSCVGTGEVTITATAPDGTKNHSITVYVAPVLTLSKNYFESCTVGESYQLNVGAKPIGAEINPTFISSDNDVATVSNNGLVTFKKNGYVSIHVSSGACEPIKAVLSTGNCTLPSKDVSTLLSVMESGANRIKSSMPALYVSNLPTFTNVKIQNESSFKTADLIGVFETFATTQSRFISAVNGKNYPETDSYDAAYNAYLSSVPVSKQNFTIIPGLTESDIKSLELIDNGSYTYDIKLTLNDEFMAVPPTNPKATSHGKVFDILGTEYLSTIQDSFSSASADISLKYTAFKQTYNNSSLTLTFDKITGNVSNMKYDMNVHVEVVDLKLAVSLITAIDSTVTFDVNNSINYEVTY